MLVWNKNNFLWFLNSTRFSWCSCTQIPSDSTGSSISIPAQTLWPHFWHVISRQDRHSVSLSSDDSDSGTYDFCTLFDNHLPFLSCFYFGSFFWHCTYFLFVTFHLRLPLSLLFMKFDGIIYLWARFHCEWLLLPHQGLLVLHFGWRLSSRTASVTKDCELTDALYWLMVFNETASLS